MPARMHGPDKHIRRRRDAANVSFRCLGCLGSLTTLSTHPCLLLFFFLSSFSFAAGRLSRPSGHRRARRRRPLRNQRALPSVRTHLGHPSTPATPPLRRPTGCGWTALLHDREFSTLRTGWVRAAVGMPGLPRRARCWEVLVLGPAVLGGRAHWAVVVAPLLAIVQAKTWPCGVSLRPALAVDSVMMMMMEVVVSGEWLRFCGWNGGPRGAERPDLTSHDSPLITQDVVFTAPPSKCDG
ncbi:uncharacterized protein J3D65DRAFT_176173 [Phyllosticta citribraziliensis]|uniref:Uncharacterized protein n=1 Tax=Phyllosticta citribraziliensis TaxID=989973 RepID=A0ABR1L1W7_9PEZI